MPVKFRETLASLMEDEPCLWDRTRNVYHMRDKKADAWDRILNKLIQLGYTYDRKVRISNLHYSDEDDDIDILSDENGWNSYLRSSCKSLYQLSRSTAARTFRRSNNVANSSEGDTGKKRGKFRKETSGRENQMTKKARLEDGISAVQEAADAVKSHWRRSVHQPTDTGTSEILFPVRHHG
ncbi:unnamed protein product [Cylicocyclus nassatus]|uniref:MADF domain-containing protein n=1 Tax=Cylicocyclus nassatus TaxID=53992 RepID=A0AA36MAZ6_CYLNA|nr:unnamed protein product [Cylicocyclus nassatus]